MIHEFIRFETAATIRIRQYGPHEADRGKTPQRYAEPQDRCRPPSSRILPAKRPQSGSPEMKAVGASRSVPRESKHASPKTAAWCTGSPPGVRSSERFARTKCCACNLPRFVVRQWLETHHGGKVTAFNPWQLTESPRLKSLVRGTLVPSVRRSNRVRLR